MEKQKYELTQEAYRALINFMKGLNITGHPIITRDEAIRSMDEVDYLVSECKVVDQQENIHNAFVKIIENINNRLEA